MSATYRRVLDHALGATLGVEFTTEKGRVLDYAVVLMVVTDETAETVRVYDAAHGFNEMHRFTRNGDKQAGVPFHPGTLADGMQVAIESIEAGYHEMIEGWR